MVEAADITATEREQALGFSVQTLRYPEESYELPSLRAESGTRLERAVALVVDDQNRIRRRHGGAGYLHETFNGLCWEAAAQFDTLDEVAGSEVYRRHAPPAPAGSGFRRFA